MSYWNHYILSQSLEEALSALRAARGPVRPIAGGTDLLIDLQQGSHPSVDTLVDLSRIPELTCVEVRGEELYIGAAVAVGDLAESSLVRRHALAVAEACGLIGGPQVRNVATLGGNVAHALPAADGMIALVAMGAQAEIACEESGTLSLRRQPLLSLFRGPGLSALIPEREILVGFYMPLLGPGQASAFMRVMRPQGVALPILNLAAWLAREGEHIKDIRLAVGPAGPIPRRAEEVEAVLRGTVYDVNTLAQASQIWRQTIRFRSSAMRASAEYRYHLSDGLMENVFEQAWQRAAS